MIKLSFLSIIIFFSLTAESQTDCDCYERNAALAKLLAFEKKPDSAIVVFQKALDFKQDSTINSSDYVLLAAYFAQVNELDSASHYLVKGIELGYSKEFLENDQDFTQLLNSNSKKKIEQAKYIIPSNFDWEYYNRIQELFGIDQLARRNGELYVFDKESLFNIIDSIVFMEVMELINLRGIPSLATHGFNNNFSIFFLHASMYSEEQFQKILSIYERYNHACLCGKGFSALLIDRRMDWYFSKPQLYGTWNFYNEFSPIASLTEVDSLRFSYNLLTLFDYSKINYMVIPNGYQVRKYPKNYFCPEN